MVVVIYEHANFQGRSQHLPVGRYDVGQLTIGNDVLSSVRVPAGFRVTLFSEARFSGKSIVLNADCPFVGKSFNDLVSSIIVETAPPPIIRDHRTGAGPGIIRAIACREVQSNEPIGTMGKMGTFPPGPIPICRFMEFANVGGHHKVELVAYRSEFGRRDYKLVSSRKDEFDDPTPGTGYRIWFSDKREDGEWREVVRLDGQDLGEITYTVGGIGE